MRARQGKRVFSTGAYIDVRDRENTQPTKLLYCLNTEMRAVQGKRVLSQGAYIDVREQDSTQLDAEMRRIYVFKTHIRV